MRSKGANLRFVEMIASDFTVYTTVKVGVKSEFVGYER